MSTENNNINNEELEKNVLTTTITDEENYGVLNWDQVRRLDELLTKTIPIHGRGNYPTLHIKLKDFIRNLNKRLVERCIRLKDIRINGGVASYVLAREQNYEFSDIDIIFTCDLLQLNNNNNEPVYSYSPEASFSNTCDIIKETVFDCLIDYIPASDCSAYKEKLTWLNIKDAYVKKMVKIYEPSNASTSSQINNLANTSAQALSRWSLISLYNNQGQNIELKFVDKMKRQFQFSVDAFQIHLDSLLKYYDIDACMTENIFPSVRAESMYGNFCEAITHLDEKLIATKRPEEIRGGGLLKYCNLLIRGYRPECDVNKMNWLEKYMCSRFFIDFSDIKEQEHKLSSYLDSHFQNDSKMCILYLNKLYQVVNASTVCLMGHERKQTLNLIDLLAKKFSNLSDFSTNSCNLLTDTKVEFYLEDSNSCFDSSSKTFSSSSSEVDSNDSGTIYYRQFKPNLNSKKNRQYNYQNNQFQQQQYNSNFKRNRKPMYQMDMQPNYQNYYYYGFYAPQANHTQSSLKEEVKPPVLTISPSGSVSSIASSSSSSVASSIVPSPSPSPPLFENDTGKHDKTEARIFYCKLPASSTTNPYIEVFENCFCPPVLPVLYEPVYHQQQQQQFYSNPNNVVTRIVPSSSYN